MDRDLNCNNLNRDNSNYPKPEKLDQGGDQHEWRGAAALLSWLGHRRLCRPWLAFHPLPTRPWVHLLQVVIVNVCCRLFLFLPPLVRISSSPHQNRSSSSPTSGLWYRPFHPFCQVSQENTQKSIEAEAEQTLFSCQGKIVRKISLMLKEHLSDKRTNCLVIHHLTAIHKLRPHSKGAGKRWHDLFSKVTSN